MPLPPVVIELSPADAASEHAPALVAACSASVAGGDCELGPGRGSEPRAVAIVSWHDERASHIEVGVRHGRQVKWIERELRFEQADPKRERWRAVGLVIGTLVGEVEAEIVREQPAPAPAQPVTKPEATAPPGGSETAPTPPLWGWVGLDAAVGPALDDGSTRAGAGVVGGARIVHPLFAVGSVRYMLRTQGDDASIDWITAALGLALRVSASESVELEFGAGPLIERLHASASAGGRSENGSRWLGGARLGAGASWTVARPWGLAIGAELEWRAGTTAIRVEDRDVGSSPTFTYVGTLGGRFSIF